MHSHIRLCGQGRVTHWLDGQPRVISASVPSFLSSCRFLEFLYYEESLRGRTQVSAPQPPHNVRLGLKEVVPSRLGLSHEAAGGKGTAGEARRLCSQVQQASVVLLATSSHLPSGCSPTCPYLPGGPLLTSRPQVRALP